MNKVQLPLTNLSSDTFGPELYKAWSEIGFVSITGYSPSIERLKGHLYEVFERFCALPDHIKMKYHYPELGGQRGYTPNGKEQSGGDAFSEYREHFMIGPKFTEDHPLRSYQPGFFVDNREVKEVSEFVELGEEMLEKLEELDLNIFEQLALQLRLPKDYFSSRIAYGDSSLRLHHYPAVEEEIIGTKKVNGVDTIIIRTKNGTIIENVVRAGRHSDIDLSASLLGAEAPGLWIEGKDGISIPYTALPNQIVLNSGDYAKHETAGLFPSSPHWVGLTEETAKRSRYSIVRFTHFRPLASVALAPQFRSDKTLGIYKDTTDAAALMVRLNEIGYFDEKERDERIKALKILRPDKEIVRDILKWEKRRGKDKLSRYY